jgi:beta-lactamase superfamily II metal-dependent hydrolase
MTANRTIIFGGDAEQAAWESIFKKYGSGLKCDVLKASHHGRDSGYHQEAVKAMSPGVTIISVGKKPDSDATNKYRKYSKKVWSTRWWGNLTLVVDNDGNMSWTASETRYAT